MMAGAMAGSTTLQMDPSGWREVNVLPINPSRDEVVRIWLLPPHVMSSIAGA